jgi:hypothetical protein
MGRKRETRAEAHTSTFSFTQIPARLKTAFRQSSSRMTHVLSLTIEGVMKSIETMIGCSKRLNVNQVVAHAIAYVGLTLLITCTVFVPRAIASSPEAVANECIPKLAPEERQYEQPLGRGIRIMSRGSKDVSQFYLASNSNLPDDCGRRDERTIFDKIEIPDISGEWVSGSFDCSSAVDSSIRRGVEVIGQFQSQHDPRLAGAKSPSFVVVRNGRPEPPNRAVAKQAWTVDLKNKRFRRVERVVCYSFDD